MTNIQHPITPPPELVREWNQNAIGTHFRPYGYSEYIATQSARWGADQELEACCEWMKQNCGRWELPAALRAARRPKPPSLKEQALAELEEIMTELHDETGSAFTASNIRRALEALPE